MFPLQFLQVALTHHVKHSLVGLENVAMRSYIATRTFAAAWCAYFNPRWAVVVLPKISVPETLARQFCNDRWWQSLCHCRVGAQFLTSEARRAAYLYCGANSTARSLWLYANWLYPGRTYLFEVDHCPDDPQIHLLV